MPKYVKSRVKLNAARVKELTQAAVTAMNQTMEAIHTDVVQSQVMPRDTGHLQNESTFVDTSESSMGRTYLVSDTPYARRMYYHPEYHFSREENPNAKGKWLEDYMAGGSKENFHKETFTKLYKRITGV